jgi:membrane fusion protein, multidrug efflux system
MRMKAFRTISPPALLSLLLLGQAGCGGQAPSTPEPQSGRAVAARVVAAAYESVPSIVEAPGTVQPRDRIVLSSQINGFVRAMRVRVGDSVQAGQLLATLDSRDAESQKAVSQASIEEANAALGEARQGYQAAVQMQGAAKASAELAAQTFSRYQKLFEARSVAPQELDEVRARRDASAAELAAKESMLAGAQDRIRQVEARISQAKAQSGRADIMVGWTEIKSPAAGKIVERSAETGTAIFPGSPLLVVESASRPQVVADLPTEYAGHLRAGMEVRLRSAETAASVGGRVVEIVPLSSPATHTIQFKVDLPSDFAPPNGQFVKVEVPVGIRNALLVPRRAIRETGQLTGLFVADASSKARFRLVRVAPFDADRVEILSGVEPGESIVVGPNDQIADGTALEIRS